MEPNFDMFNHILEVVQKKEQKMIFYKPSQRLIKSSFETRSESSPSVQCRRAEAGTIIILRGCSAGEQ